MGAKLIGMKTPSIKIGKVEQQVDKSTSTLLYKLSSKAEVELKQRTPVDTGNMLKCWKKTPLVGSGKTKTIEIYNTATNPRTGFLYPIALEYGFHHYAWGTYVGFKPGLFYREATFNQAKNNLAIYLPDFYRTVLRVWR